MTIPIPTMDKFTMLGELGFTQPTLALRLEAFYKNLTALNTVGELLQRSLDQQMARDVLGITSSGSGSIQVPNEISATGTPGPTTFLAGDGSWKPITSGNTSISQITDLSPLAADLLNDALPATWLTKLNAVPVGSVGAANGVAGLDATALLKDINKPPSWTTATDLAQAIDGVVLDPPDLTAYATKAELNQKANDVNWNGTSWPPHAVTSSATNYYGGPGMPTPDGNNVIGGGGMVPGLDRWFGILTT